MKPTIGFSVPSYNESSSIVTLISKIKAAVPNSLIIIVDDSNKEENKSLKTNLSKSKFRNNQDVILISRLEKNGRGNAVLRGYEELLKYHTINYFFELDADLSHSPIEALTFLEKIKEERADIVIGSRYLEKSNISKWTIKRRVLSKIINKCINIWLGLELSDYTNGFRLYNRKAVEFLLRIQLKEKGFISLSETAFRLKKMDLRQLKSQLVLLTGNMGNQAQG